MNETLKIFIIAPPRSGSTLTLQLFTSAFNNIHLTNLWSMFYATPFLAGRVLKKSISKKAPSDFKSNYGLVNGLHGEAEGMRFWQYWTGQGLNEKQTPQFVKKVKYLNKVLDNLGVNSTTPFIAGYLGHSLCINELRSAFKNSIFIFLTRDPLANALSLYNASPESSFSIKTKEMEGAQNRMDEIARQLSSIYDKMKKSINSDTFICSYEDICSNPIKVLNEFKLFANTKKLNINFKYRDSVPKRFNQKDIDMNSPVTKKLEEALRKYDFTNFKL